MNVVHEMQLQGFSTKELIKLAEDHGDPLHKALAERIVNPRAADRFDTLSQFGYLTVGKRST